MINPFNHNNKEVLVIPARAAIKVTPSDTDNLPDGVCRALLCGSGGSADIIDADGNDCVGLPLQTGYNPIGAARIKLTNLVASNIWALY